MLNKIEIVFGCVGIFLLLSGCNESPQPHIKKPIEKQTVKEKHEITDMFKNKFANIQHATENKNNENLYELGYKILN